MEGWKNGWSFYVNTAIKKPGWRFLFLNSDVYSVHKRMRHEVFSPHLFYTTQHFIGPGIFEKSQRNDEKPPGCCSIFFSFHSSSLWSPHKQRSCRHCVPHGNYLSCFLLSHAPPRGGRDLTQGTSLCVKKGAR